MRSFLRELKRRNVYKVGAVYAVGGWLLVQVATQVLPLFEVSALALRLIVLAVLAGFPIAPVLSWVYEVLRKESPGPPRSRRGNRSPGAPDNA